MAIVVAKWAPATIDWLHISLPPPPGLPSRPVRRPPGLFDDSDVLCQKTPMEVTPALCTYADLSKRRPVQTQSSNNGAGHDAPDSLLEPMPYRLHQEARALLNDITAAGISAATNNVVELEGRFKWPNWEKYVKQHKHKDEIIGSGMLRARAEFIAGTTDPNRGGQERCDLVILRTDGTSCRLHPGLETITIKWS